MRFSILSLIYITLVNSQFISSPQNTFCSCSDILDSQVCTSSSTLQGICGWRNGECYELTCQERTISQLQCEADYGTQLCGWYMNSTCVNPVQCYEISTPQQCQVSGCIYVYSNNNLTQGQCTGPSLNTIQCQSLIASQCYGSFFYDYTNNYYQYCYLDSNGLCQTMIGCNQATSLSQCTQPYCFWIIAEQACVTTTCEVLISQSQCDEINQNYIVSAYQNCEWTGTQCVNTICQSLTQSQCYQNGYCFWTGQQCQNLQCSSLTNANSCFSYNDPYVSQPQCTWVVNSDGNGGQCSSCNAYGPSILVTPSGYPAFNLIIQVMLSSFLLIYII